MNSQPVVYMKNKPRVTLSMVNCGFTEMSKTFGEHLKEKMDEAGIKAAELSRRSGVTKQNIGRLVNNTPHTITNALPTTEKPTVEKLAKALNWTLDDALLAAGIAPENNSNIETTQFDENVRVQLLGAKHFTEDDKREYLESFQVAYEVAKRRIAEKKKQAQ